MQTLTQKNSAKFATKHFNIGVIAPLTQKRNSKFFFRACEAICDLGFAISILAIGDEESQSKCFELAQKYPDQFEVLEAIPKNKNKILNHANVILFPSIPMEENLRKVLKKGIVPIMPYQKHFYNFDAQAEFGNAFLFSENNFWDFFATIIRAFENFKFSYDWNNLQKQVKKAAENF